MEIPVKPVIFVKGIGIAIFPYIGLCFLQFVCLILEVKDLYVQCVVEMRRYMFLWVKKFLLL